LFDEYYYLIRNEEELSAKKESIKYCSGCTSLIFNLSYFYSLYIILDGMAMSVNWLASWIAKILFLAGKGIFFDTTSKLTVEPTQLPRQWILGVKQL
jgi:hypothetical protein